MVEDIVKEGKDTSGKRNAEKTHNRKRIEHGFKCTWMTDYVWTCAVGRYDRRDQNINFIGRGNHWVYLCGEVKGSDISSVE